MTSADRFWPDDAPASDESETSDVGSPWTDAPYLPTPLVSDVKGSLGVTRGDGGRKRNLAQTGALTSSPQGSPASPAAWRALAEAMKMLVGSGPKRSESCAFYDPDGACWRTYQDCFQWTEGASSGECFTTWTQQGLMFSGRIYLLPRSVPRISATASSLWRTPQANEAGARVETLATKDGGPPELGKRAYRTQPDGKVVLQSQTLNQQVQYVPTPTTGDSKSACRHTTTTGIMHPGTTLTDFIRMWPTPGTQETTGGPSDPRARLEQGHAIKLKDAVRMWPTPQAHDAAPGDPKRVGRYGTKHGGRNLNDEVAMWPTPGAADADRKGADYARALRPRSGGPDLSTAVKMLPTPQARDWKSGGGGTEPHGAHAAPLSAVAGGQLNPRWVEWLMGFPLGWTDLGRSGTRSSRKSRKRSGG